MPTTAPVRSRKRVFFRRLRYLLTGFLGLLIALACAGAIYEAIASHRDRQRFHPPGRLVDIGGYRLHLYCTGEGAPGVILEAGGGNPWLSWYKVQPQVAQFTRVCSYDRAGLGWSDPSPKPRTTKVIAEELHTLLHNAGIAGPFVLVGHSLGGMDARMFASQYPSEVVGMVLVDSSHPDQDDRFPPEAKKLAAATKYVIRTMQITLPIGLPRLLAARSVPKEVQPEFCAVFCRPQFIAAVRAEAAAQAENSAQVRALGPLGAMPLVVLSHDPDKVHFPGNLTEPVNREWNKMQEEQSQLSSNGSHLVIKGSGHDIQIDKPESVVDAVRKVVSQSNEGWADQYIGRRISSLSASQGGNPVDCGSTTMNKPDANTTACAKVAFQDHRPFHSLYSRAFGFFQFAYGLAGDANGNVYEVEYDSRGLLNLGLGKRSQVFDGNRVRVTTCMKPVRLGNAQEGLLACITPLNDEESKLAAQQKAIETTVCAILEHPSVFNNKIVRIHGYASGNFEYSELGADGCAASLWFAYGNAGGPPDLVAIVSGGARPGSEDAQGRLLLPVPVKLVQDSNFQRFQKLMIARAKADERNSTKEDADTWTFYRVAATFTGRIDGVSDDVHAFHLKRNEMDRADFLGFGQLGLFDAQFVLQSVGNDAVLENFPPTPNPMRNSPPRARLTR